MQISDHVDAMYLSFASIKDGKEIMLDADQRRLAALCVMVLSHVQGLQKEQVKCHFCGRIGECVDVRCANTTLPACASCLERGREQMAQAKRMGRGTH